MRTIIVDVDSIDEVDTVFDDFCGDRLIFVGTYDREVNVRLTALNDANIRFYHISNQKELPGFVHGFLMGMSSKKISLPDEFAGIRGFLSGSTETTVLTTRPAIFEECPIDVLEPSTEDEASDESDVSSLSD